MKRDENNKIKKNTLYVNVFLLYKKRNFQEKAFRTQYSEHDQIYTKTHD